MSQPKPYDPLDDARLLLKTLSIQGGMNGCGARELAAELKRQMPDLISLLEMELLTDWVRDELRKMTDTHGLPLVRSVGERYVYRAFWDENAYREVIGGFISRSRANLAKARMLADEAARVLGVRIAVPELRDAATP